MRILFVLISIFISNQLMAQTETESLNNTVEPASNELNLEIPVVKPTNEQDTMLVDKDAELKKEKTRFFEKRSKQKVEAVELKEREKKDAPKPSLPVTVESEVEGEGVLLEDSQFEPTNSSFGYSNEINVESSSIPSVRATEIYSTNSTNFSVTNERSNMQRMQRSPSIDQQVEMDAAVEYFEVNDPTSFEYNYFKYTAGNYDVSLYNNLAVAESARPNNSDVHIQMAGYFMIKGEQDSALVYLDKLIESERLTNNVVAYAEDVLRSVPEEGVLITHGFDDSYGVYYAQLKNNIRPDVTLMSLDFMQSDYYRESFQSKGCELPKSDVINVTFLNDFCLLNEDKNLSIALTTPKEYFKPMKGKLFIVGLVFEYHKDKFDNFYSNDYLWNEQFTKDLIDNPIDEKGKQLSANYLPMLLYLRKVYEQRGEDEKREEVDRVTDQIGVQSNKYEQVQKVKAAY